VSGAKASCPECGVSCLSVGIQTIKHHIKVPWLWDDSSGDYYFCTSQGCETVYFSSNGLNLFQKDLRLLVGVKLKAEDALICYCFDVSRADAANPAIKSFVSNQTKAKQCACVVRNPSGRCCLKDFS